MSDFEAPRADLIRMTDLAAAEVEFRTADEDDGHLGTLAGYAAVFNEDTVIATHEARNYPQGKFVERIAPGAFKKTLRERGDKVKVLFNHGFDPSIGDKPLGKPITQLEDARGLYVEVPLDDTSYNRDLVASLRSGALDGMSFRFSVNREDEDRSDPNLPVRTLREVTLFEYGPVTFPAYEATTAGVRGRDAYQAWRTIHPNVTVTDEVMEEIITDAADTGTSEIEPGTPALRHLSDNERARLRARTNLLFTPWSDNP